MTEIETGCPNAIKVAIYGEWAFGESMGHVINMGLSLYNWGCGYLQFGALDSAVEPSAK